MKDKDASKILLISIIAGFLGAAKELIPMRIPVNGLTLRGILETFSFTRLSFLKTEGSTATIGKDLLIHVSFFDFIFSLLLFAGGIIYHVTKTKDTRLIRFCFSIAFLSQVLVLLTHVFSFLSVDESFYKPRFKDYIMFLLFSGMRIFLAWVSFWVVKKINGAKNLKLTVYESGEASSAHFKEVSKWQRFWHWIADSLIFILIFSYLILAARVNTRRTFSHLPESNFLPYFIVVLLRVIYYMVYEVIFSATPAKFLTETRVTGNEGEKVNFLKILARTFSRLIPFEPFSFLANANWHDKLSGTYVLNEERAGYKPVFYFWLFIIILIICAGIYFGMTFFGKNHDIYFT